MQILRKLLAHLTAFENKRAWVLMGMILVTTLLDKLGMASIMPFMAVLTNPGLVQTNYFLNAAFTPIDHIGILIPQQFLFALFIYVFVLMVTSLIIKALTTYAQIRFKLTLEHNIGKRLVGGYLYQPYTWFLNRHSADFARQSSRRAALLFKTAWSY
jgi:ABC-type uncharacterized transport system fused permease/ATPase subunit